MTLYIVQAATPQSFYSQGCFAIDYDFADHRCYFFPVNVVQIYMNTPDDIPTTPNLAPAPFPLLLHCVIASGVPQPGSLGLRPNPTVVHVTLCEFRILCSADTMNNLYLHIFRIRTIIIYSVRQNDSRIFLDLYGYFAEIRLSPICFRIFTALHEMSARISHQKSVWLSVCPSIRLSVCQTRDL